MIAYRNSKHEALLFSVTLLVGAWSATLQPSLTPDSSHDSVLFHLPCAVFLHLVIGLSSMPICEMEQYDSYDPSLTPVWAVTQECDGRV